MAGKADAFLEVPRRAPGRQAVADRLSHWREIYLEMSEADVRLQASRCMSCGTPFCHGYGCPLGNVIPEWNAFIVQDRWRDAVDLLHLTNNFPEITGRVCPALCEAACTLGLGDEAVTVRYNELAIIEKGFRHGWITPRPPAKETGKKAAVIGSGPAGLAAAQQLRRAGHQVVVYEKADRPGGILRYGIPDFKLEKWILDRRLDQLKAEGVVFETSVTVGEDISAEFIRKRYNAIALALGSRAPRDLPAPGRELNGIHQAMTYLTQQNKRLAGLPLDGDEITASGKRVVIIGGGDTGADCLGTALRQGARTVHQLEILPRPPEDRDPATPWPQWPNMLRTSAAHEEGGERRWSVGTTAFIGQDGRVTGLKGHVVDWKKDDSGRMTMTRVDDSDFEMQADLVLLAMGFVHPRHEGLLDHLGVAYDGRGNVLVDADHKTSVSGVYAAGDVATGASLVVRAIAAGRRMARRIDLYLMGESALPDVAPPNG